MILQILTVLWFRAGRTPQIGLPHYLVFGGSVAEPLDAAELLGCPRWAFVALSQLVSALMAWGLVEYLRRGQASDRPVEV
jgi:hypothetical protein